MRHSRHDDRRAESERGRRGALEPRRGPSSAGSRAASCRRDVLVAAGVSHLTRLARSVATASANDRRRATTIRALFIANRGEIAARISADLRATRDPGDRPRRPTARAPSTCSTSTPSSRPRARPAPTPSIRASGSSPRTRTSPRRSRPPGSAGSGRRRRRSGRWATRPRRAGWRSRLGVPVLAGYDGRGPVGRRAIDGRRADRLPAPRQAGGRRRRQGHADRARPGRLARRARRRPARGHGGVRRRPADPRAPRSRARATSRSRSCSMRTATASTSANATARSSGDTRRSSRSRRRRPSMPTCATASAMAALRLAAGVGYVERRDVRVPRRRSRATSLPRDEHAAPGRASGHGARHRSRSRRRPAPDRRRRAARDLGQQTSSPPATPSRSASTPRTPRPGSCRRRVGSRRSAGRAARASGSTPGSSVGERDRRPLRPDAGEGHRPGPDRPTRFERLTAALDETRRPGRRDEPAVPALARPPAGRPRGRGADRHPRSDLAAGRLGRERWRSPMRRGRPPRRPCARTRPRGSMGGRLAAERGARRSASRPTGGRARSRSSPRPRPTHRRARAGPRRRRRPSRPRRAERRLPARTSRPMSTPRPAPPPPTAHGRDGPGRGRRPDARRGPRVHVAVGGPVAAGDPIVTLEAMKMEHVVARPDRRPHRRPVGVRPGDQVARGQLLASSSPDRFASGTLRLVPTGGPHGS